MDITGNSIPANYFTDPLDLRDSFTVRQFAEALVKKFPNTVQPELQAISEWVKIIKKDIKKVVIPIEPKLLEIDNDGQPVWDFWAKDKIDSNGLHAKILKGRISLEGIEVDCDVYYYHPRFLRDKGSETRKQYANQKVFQINKVIFPKVAYFNFCKHHGIAYPFTINVETGMPLQNDIWITKGATLSDLQKLINKNQQLEDFIDVAVGWVRKEDRGEEPTRADLEKMLSTRAIAHQWGSKNGELAKAQVDSLIDIFLQSAYKRIGRKERNRVPDEKISKIDRTKNYFP